MEIKNKSDLNVSEKSADEVKIIFTPSGHQGKVTKGLTLLEAARQMGVDLDSVCGGRAMCGRCQISVSEGEFAKHKIISKSSHLSPQSNSEKRYAQKRNLSKERRLSCQSKILSDVVIDVPPESQVHRQVIRKVADDREIIINPGIHLYFIEVTEPDMHDPSSDFERLCKALIEQWGEKVSNDISADLHVIQKLQSTLRNGNWKVTVAIKDKCKVIEIWPNLKEEIYGIALDIGSTTISAHLVNLHTGVTIASAGEMNPQIRFGEDLMSRVSYVMMNSRGEEDLTKAVREGIQKLINYATKKVKIEISDVLEIVFVGNPVMHHLFLGINPIELGGAPFALSIDDTFECLAKELDLSLSQGTRVFSLPCIAGHVGADAASATLAEKPHKKSEISLIVDVGTNAEIILGNNQRILAASSPTGPAFEGAQISCGQRAANGAIERVRIDPLTHEPRYSVIGIDGWSDEECFHSGENIQNITGICGSGIIEVIAEMYISEILTSDGIIRGDLQQKSNRIIKNGRTYSYKLTDKVIITQNDIRAIQLAKAALHAGFRLLMDKLKIEHVDKVYLAGAFGSHIDPKYAMILGIVPDCALKSVTSIGNSAGAGARLALLSIDERKEVKNLVKNIEKIETAVEPNFQKHFVEAMAFPHKSNPYPLLRKQVSLPKKEIVNENKKIRSRRRL